MDATAAYAPINWPVTFEKIISIALVAAAIVFFSPRGVGEAIIAFGQGHFIACYYYQIKYHHIDRPYLIRYFACLILLFGGYIYYPNLPLLVTIASIYFVVHLSVDERFLWTDKVSLQRGLAFLPLLVIYSGMLIDRIYVYYMPGTGAQTGQAVAVPALGLWLLPYFMWAAGVALAAYLLVVLISRQKIEAHDLYFLLAAGFLAVLYFTNHVPNRYYLMGGVILYHYSNWYIHYFIRWGSDRAKRNNYVMTMIVINLIVLGLYAFFKLYPDALEVKYVPRLIFAYKAPTHGNVLAYLFSPGYFYLWTLMHFISTARLSDINYLRPRLRP